MKIQSVVARGADLGLTRPYTITYKTVDSVTVSVVEISLANGLMGIGSSNPSKYVVGESVEDTIARLTPENLEWLVGRDIREFNQLIDEVHERFGAYPGVCSALDIALYDAFGQYLGIPIVSFLGQKIQKLLTSITIGIKNVEETLVEADEYVGRGFRSLKVKIGHSIEVDLERLFKIREKYPNVLMRVDANQGYTLEQVAEFHHKTASLNLELVEQPVPADATDSLRGLPEEIRKTIAIDESLVTPESAFRWASPPFAGGIFNIKLMKCGGIKKALDIATIAKNSGTSLMWGCNDESIVSISAALHAALSCPHTRFLDLDGSLDLARDLVTGGFVLEDGLLSVNGKPGLGVMKFF